MISFEYNFIKVVGFSLVISNLSTFILLIFSLKRFNSLVLIIMNNKLNILYLIFIFLMITRINDFLFSKILITVLIIVYIIYNVNSTILNVKKYNNTSSRPSKG
jgi:hypothetical protein